MHDAVLRETVHLLVAQYRWSLLSEEELVQRTQQSIAEGATASFDQLIRRQYQLALYEACRQTADRDLRKAGFTEVFHHLYRLAYNRWPDIAEDVAQRALVLVAERIGTCTNPEAMLLFSAFQARRAATELIRMVQKELSLDRIADQGGDIAQPDLESARFDEDCLHLLLDTLRRLPERERQVISLKYFDGLSDELIAERVQISVNFVRVSRNRAMKRLRQDEQLRQRCLQNEL